MKNKTEEIKLIEFLIGQCQSLFIKDEWGWGAEMLRNSDIKILKNIKRILEDNIK